MKRFLIPAILFLLILPNANSDTAIRIVTYNIHHTEGTDGKLDLDRIARVILSERPDIVCLQEVDQGCGRTNGIDMPAELAKLLNMDVCFGSNLEFDGGKYGNATFTRFPIATSENSALPFPGEGERRGCLRITTRIQRVEVDVHNTHFDLLAESRRMQANAILKRMRDTPSVLAGDLNETADAPALRILLSRMTDSFSRKVGDPESTLPGDEPGRRIDFILLSNTLRVLSSRVVDTPEARLASDHLPYVSEISLPPASENAADKGVRDTEDERVERALAPRD
ncbi:MAG: endonuclease/exonuclease/phosphatase family protein [Candidatus Hydrogenedentales bacterium]|jgi:endonuclease/exonuclease/phosphatase family metal-dependent hydrolase